MMMPMTDQKLKLIGKRYFMTTWIRPVIVVLLVVCFFSEQGDTSAEQRLSRTGACGDALPEGAMARLGSLNWRLLAEANSIVVSPDGRALSVTSNDFTVTVLDAKTGECKLALGIPTQKSGSGRPIPVAFSANGKRIATYIVDKEWKWIISVWNTADKHEEQRIQFWKKDRAMPKLPPEAEIAPNRHVETREYISAMAFSPDGKVLAASVRFYFHGKWWREAKDPVFLETEENIVRLWEVSSGKQLLELTGHKKEIKNILFSEDGNTLTTAGEDGTICFWDTSTGQEQRARLKSDRPLFCMTSSPDGKLLAGGSQESVLIWEASTGKVRARLAIPVPEVQSIAFTRDGKLLAGAGGRAIRIWATDTGALLREASTVCNSVKTIAFSSDGTRLFSGHKDEQVVRCWDVGTLKASLELDGHAAPVRALAFTPDAKQILTTSLGGDLRLWDAFSGRPRHFTTEECKLLETYWLASTGRSWPLFCENGMESEFGPLRTPKLSRVGQSPIVYTCSADGKWILASKNERNKKTAFVLSDNQTGKVLREFIWKEGDEVSASLSPDGMTVGAAVNDVVSFFDIRSGKERRYDFAGKKLGEPFRPTFVKFSPDGLRIVVVGDPATLRVVSALDGRLLAEIRETVWDSIGSLAGVAFSPDGKTLTVGKHKGVLMLWEVSTGQLIRHQRGDNFLFSPDNRLVAILRRGTLHIHDLYSGELLRQYKEPNGFVGSFTFSPDGRMVAAACRDTTILICDTISPAKTDKPRSLEERSLQELWKDLEERESSDHSVEDWMKKSSTLWKDVEEGKSARAYKAIGKLISDPERSLSFLKKRLKVPTVDIARLEQLIANLDNHEFNKREAASRELSDLGVVAGPTMRAALTKQPSPEMRRRLESLLREVDEKQDRFSLAIIRVIQALESIGTRDAQQLLKSLAEGAGGTFCTRDAREALQRIQRKQ